MLMQLCSLCAFWTILIETLCGTAPMCVRRRGKERALHAAAWKWGQVAFISRPENAEVVKPSSSFVLHYQMAGAYGPSVPGKSRVPNPPPSRPFDPPKMYDLITEQHQRKIGVKWRSGSKGV
eukprot:1151737-Pelagomonas_calceolata.AAC.1